MHILVFIVDRNSNQIPVVQFNKPNHQLQATSPHNKLWAVVRQLRYNNPTSSTYQTKNSEPHHSTSNTCTNPVQTNHQQVKTQLPPLKSNHLETDEAGSPLPKSQRIIPKRQTEFVGHKNLVMSIKQNCDTHTHFSQDKIRDKRTYQYAWVKDYNTSNYDQFCSR